jgi:hypothetical protein
MLRAFLLCATIVCPIVSAEVPELFAPSKASDPARRASWLEPGGVRVVRSEVAESRHGLIDEGAPMLRLNLFRNLSLTAVRTGFQATGDGRTRVWTGSLDGQEAGSAVIAVTDGIMHGSVQTGTGTFYEIRPAASGGSEIRQVEYEGEKVVDDAVPVSLSATNETEAASGVTVVDVLILYTAAARQAAGGTTAIQNKIVLAITEINQSYLNSGIPMELRLARAAEVAYDESGGIETALTRLTSMGDGFMDEAQVLRNQSAADLVQLWINGPGAQGGTVGLAWLMNTASSYFEAYAYSVVEVNFATGPYYSSGHEFGHNQGAAHDRANASGQGAYAYAYGYQKASGAYPFRTIMSYACAGVYCPKLNYWSNPELQYQGQPLGVASTAANAADNRLALTNTRAIVAGFRNAAQQMPVPQSVSPSSGSGSNGTFVATYDDANGAADMAGAYVLVHSQVRADAGCFIHYNRAAGTVQLLNDSASAWSSAAVAGSSSTLSNSQCRIDVAGVRAPVSGNRLQLTLPITFTSAFSGSRNVYLLAIDAAGNNSNWYLKGSWMVSGVQAAPRPVSLTPSTGTGVSATFTGTYSDANGAADIAGAYFLIHSQIRADAGCFIYYSRAANTVQLLSDNGSWWSAPAAAGGSSTLSNAQCSISASGVTAAAAGNNLTVNMPVTFRSSFGGTKTLYLLAIDTAGANSNWSGLGTWTVPVAQQMPAPSSVSPSSASGTTVTLSGVFSDANGATDIVGAYFLIHNQIRADAGCFVYYNRVANTFQVLADVGWPWSSALTPGSGSASNSRCTINGAGSSASAGGNTLTVNLSLTAKSAFKGTQNVYLLAIDSAGANSNWHLKGTWTTGY